MLDEDRRHGLARRLGARDQRHARRDGERADARRAPRTSSRIGGGLILGPVRLDLGYAHVFFADRTVTNSRSFQLNPIQPALAVPVGNGRYTVSADILTAGLEARF